MDPEEPVPTKAPKGPKLLESKKGAVKTEQKKEAIQIGVEGFLVPRHYRNQSVYRNHPIFRGTLLILILAIATAGLISYEGLLASQSKKVVLATQELEVAESARLQNQAAILKPIRDKYRELEILRRQLRIPFAPILDSIEKTIPEKISVNRITSICPPVAATSALKRKNQIQIEVYFPGDTNPTDEELTLWPKTIGAKLKEYGLKMTKTDWGAQKKFIPNTDQEKKMKDITPGATRELTFTVELGTETK